MKKEGSFDEELPKVDVEEAVKEGLSAAAKNDVSCKLRMRSDHNNSHQFSQQLCLFGKETSYTLSRPPKLDSLEARQQMNNKKVLVYKKERPNQPSERQQKSILQKVEV